MDSTEREPSYYEVALTHRQVLAGFVILLACLFAAFFSGIWIGQGSGPRGETHVAAVDPATAAQDAKLDQLTFFGDRSKNGADGARAVGSPPVAKPVVTPPPAAEPTPAESEAEKLRATLEAEMNAHREGAAAPATTTQAAAPAVGARVQRAPSTEPAARPATPAPAKVNGTATAAATPPPAAATANGTFWVQVYSTATRAKADEVVARLKKGGYPTRLLLPSGTTKNFRVRVGPYPARDKATTVADKLRKDLRLETWVTDRL